MLRVAFIERERDLFYFRFLSVVRLDIRAAEVKAARDAQGQGESALAARESSKLFFKHLAGYKARP